MAAGTPPPSPLDSNHDLQSGEHGTHITKQARQKTNSHHTHVPPPLSVQASPPNKPLAGGVHEKECEEESEPLPSSTSTCSGQGPPSGAPSNKDRGPRSHKKLAFAALSLSLFLAALDTVLLPTALPTISRDFHISNSLYAWVGSSYLLANAASVPFWGKISDVFGRKPVILAANAVFLVGSIIGAVGVNAMTLVAGRAIQGVGGGGVVVMAHVCVSDLFTIRDRSFYMGTLGGVWAVASALGPVLGGIFAEHLTWRSCFYINFPIISLSLVVLYFTLELRDAKVGLLDGLAGMDWLGTLTILAATVLFLAGLQLGGSKTFASPVVIVFLALGISAYIAFPFVERWVETRGASPITPMRIFKDMSNLSSLAVCACDALIFNSVAYFVPLYIQIMLGKSPSMAGVYMLAIAIPLAIVSVVSGHIIELSGRFLEVLQVGLSLMTVGIGLLISLGTSPGHAELIGILIVVGLGFGPNFGAPLIALQTRIRTSDMATGTAAFGFVRMVFGAIGLVVGQVVFQALMQPRFGGLVEAGVAAELAHAITGGDVISRIDDVARLPQNQQRVAMDDLTSAFRGTWIFFTAIAALGVVVSFGIKRTRLRRESHAPSEASPKVDAEKSPGATAESMASKVEDSPV